MADLWFISDTHFGHENACKLFKRHDGSPLRNFASAAECDEHIIDRWNAVVRPQDHVYHLGDVAMKRAQLQTIKRCNGHLRLVRGNHDIFKTKEYLEYFDEIYGCRVFDNIIFTHIPIHEGSLGRFAGNVHGHLHHQPAQIGDKYLNISVEMLNDYTPISLEQIKKIMKERDGKP